jgi:hypothetical protein
MTINQSSALVRQSPTESELRGAAAIAWRLHFTRFWWNWRKKIKVCSPVIKSSPIKFVEEPYQTVGYWTTDQIPRSTLALEICSRLRIPASLKSHSPRLISSQCQKCHNYHGQTYAGNLLVCAIHPSGVERNCDDFEAGGNNQNRRSDRQFHSSFFQLVIALSNPDQHSN